MAPTVLYLFTRRFAESTELKKNTHKRYMMNANMLIRKGEKSKRDTVILYKGVVFSPGTNADFVIKAGIHKANAIKTTTTCCAR